MDIYIYLRVYIYNMYIYIYVYIVAFYSKPIQASSDLEVFEDVAHGLARHHLGWGTSDFLVEK